MEQQQPHETPPKSKKYIKYILLGISILTLMSAISMPWSTFTDKEITISILGLLFVNAFLVWLYKIQYSWKEKILHYLERKYKVKIVWNLAGSFSIVGDVNMLIKLAINLQILFFFIVGVAGPLAVFIGFLFLIK